MRQLNPFRDIEGTLSRDKVYLEASGSRADDPEYFWSYTAENAVACTVSVIGRSALRATFNGAVNSSRCRSFTSGAQQRPLKEVAVVGVKNDVTTLPPALPVNDTTSFFRAYEPS